MQRNPVLVLGLDLPFVIVTAITLRNAAAMSILMFLIHTVTMLVAIVTCRKLPFWARIPVNTAVATVVLTLSRRFVMLLLPSAFSSANIYISLLAVNGMTLLQAGFLDKRQKPLQVLSSALTNALAFSVAMFLVAFVREYFGSGSLWGTPMPAPIRLTGVQMAFFGFILMGFLLALVKFFNRRIRIIGILEEQRREQPFPRRR